MGKVMKLHAIRILKGKRKRVWGCGLVAEKFHGRDNCSSSIHTEGLCVDCPLRDTGFVSLYRCLGTREGIPTVFSGVPFPGRLWRLSGPLLNPHTCQAHIISLSHTPSPRTSILHISLRPGGSERLS